MSGGELSQAEADALLAMAKVKASDEEVVYPQVGGAVSVPLRSVDGREEFLLDISRGRIDLKRGKYQNRARHTVVLARLDFGGAPHRNPDGAAIACPHLHLYREGYGDKWAFPLPVAHFEGHFSDVSDLWQTLQEFMSFCHIVEPPVIRRGLFV